MAAKPGAYMEDTMSNFRADLEHLINRESAENGSNTPDFILACYLTDCLNAFDRAVNDREAWYGRERSRIAPLDSSLPISPPTAEQ